MGMSWLWLAYWLCLTQPQETYQIRREGLEWCYDKPRNMRLTPQELSFVRQLGIDQCGLSYKEIANGSLQEVSGRTVLSRL